ncbi:MAG: FapA family protein, partial [bacterium]
MREVFAEVLGILKSGVSDAIQDLEQYQQSEPSSTLRNAISELKTDAQFLEQVVGWLETMPPDRLREVLQSSIMALRKTFLALIESGEVQTLANEGEETDQTPGFLLEAAERLGPRLFIREDKMQVSVQIDSKDREMWTEEKVESFLEREGIVHGVNSDAIKKMFADGTVDQPVLVATGTNPVLGKNGQVKYAFELEAISGRPKELESGSVDHKELNLFYYVNPGHLLAELIPPEQGIAGANVCGEEIPTEDGVPAELIAGENTAISDDGIQLLAQVEGYLSLDGKV